MMTMKLMLMSPMLWQQDCYDKGVDADAGVMTASLAQIPHNEPWQGRKKAFSVRWAENKWHCKVILSLATNKLSTKTGEGKALIFCTYRSWWIIYIDHSLSCARHSNSLCPCPPDQRQKICCQNVFLRYFCKERSVQSWDCPPCIIRHLQSGF